MILGQDWLEEYSPMWVHWRTKVMKFTYQKKRIVLKGIRPDIIKCSPIGGHKLKVLLRRKAITHCVQMLPPVPQTNIPLPESVLFSMSDPTQLEVVPEIQ